MADAVRRVRAREWGRYRALLIVCGAMYAVLLVIFGVGLTGGATSGADLRFVAVGFGAWLTVLLAGLSVYFLTRRLSFARDLERGRAIEVRTRLKRFWLMSDSEDGEVFDEQYMRAKGVRGVLLVPLGFHRAFGEPREAVIVYTRGTKVLLSVDGIPVWSEL